jgi:hypothetical protein
MTRDDIIRLAREAGLRHFYDSEGHCSGVTNAKIEGDKNDDALVEILALFAALVAAAEREACEKVCEEMARRNDAEGSDVDWVTGNMECADAIRARGQ